MTMNLKIDYVEFYSDQLEDTEAFFTKAFDWTFTEYGPNYRDISKAGIGAGLERGQNKAPLIVLRTDDLDLTYAQISAAGAKITKDIFAFPGGKRFEFIEPSGTKMAVWCEA